MKKLIAAILSIALLLAALALPAMAEETDVQSSATAAVTAKGGSRGGQQPRGRGPMGGQNAPSQGQTPGQGGKNNAPQGQAPGNGNLNGQNGSQNNGQNNDQNNGQSGSQGQMPFPNQKDHRFTQPRRDVRHGSGAGSDTQNGQQSQPADQAQPDASSLPGAQDLPAGIPGPLDLSGLVSQGIIDAETLTKIEEYLKENAPAQPAAPAQGMTPPEKPADDQTSNGTEPPALPDDQAPVADPMSELLSTLVEKGILTQEQADAISTTAAPAETTGTEAST